MNLSLIICEKGKSMWSKTKKGLMSHLADSLQERVVFNMEVYERYRYCEWVFYIFVDKEMWFASNPNIWIETRKREEQMRNECKMKNNDWEKGRTIRRIAEQQAIKETGYLSTDKIMERVHDYLNVANIEECLNRQDYFLYLLAILDRRVGKRRLKMIYENITDEPQWIQKYILLRAEAEGLCGNAKHG